MAHQMLHGMHTRTEWVKMKYADGPMVVGVIHPVRPGEWAFFHKTDDTQYLAALDSPMGLDVGTYAYLTALETPPACIDFLAEGAPQILRTPLTAFTQYRSNPQHATTLKGQFRSRIFVPTAQWWATPIYLDVRPPHWDVTHIFDDGRVEGRYVDSRARR